MLAGSVEAWALPDDGAGSEPEAYPTAVRQLVPSATNNAFGGAARTAGNSDSSAIFIEMS